MTTPLGDPKALLQAFEDAALQRHFLKARRTDSADSRMTGVRFDYAIDSNIVHLYCNPAANAVSSQRQLIGVGEIFRSDDETRKISVAASIAHFVFFDLTASTPLLILLPINQEVYSIARPWLHKLEAQGLNNPAELKRLIRKIKKKKGHQFNLEDLTILRAAYLNDRHEAAAIRRLGGLLKAGRILSSDLAVRSRLFAPEVREALLPARTKEDIDTFGKRWKLWKACFEKVGRQSSPSADFDAEAKARLSIANERLETIASDARRLLYVTMDNSLLEAGQLYFRDLDNRGAAPTFTDLYLRHPRAYLNEVGVLRPNPDRLTDDGKDASLVLREDSWENASHVTLDEWFDLLFGSLDDIEETQSPEKGRIQFKEKTELAINALAAADKNAHTALVQKWGAYETAQAYDLPGQLHANLQAKLGEDYQVFRGAMLEFW